MNKQCSLLLHSILILGALFSLLPDAQLVQVAPIAPSIAPQIASPIQPDVMLIRYGRGAPRSRGGGGTR